MRTLFRLFSLLGMTTPRALAAYISFLKAEMLTSEVLGSGVGRETALTFASRGVRVLICADIIINTAKETTYLCQSREPEPRPEFEAVAMQVDARDELSVREMVEKTVSQYERIDYFVSTAGICPFTILLNSFYRAYEDA